ncbi:MAG: RluA family pseudouridine synthase [Coprococcus sp.]
MQEIIVADNEAGQRLTKLLMKYLDKAPSSFVYKMLRKKNIKLNGIKAKGDEMLTNGDIVQLYLSDETIAGFRSNLPKNPISSPNKDNIELKVIYEDENILIADKPAGVLSQKALADDYSINEAFIDYMLKKGCITPEQLKTFKPSICNRLDRNTSGLIICGKSLTGSQNMNNIIKSRLVDKYYVTIVYGEMKETIDSICYHVKDGTKVHIYNNEPDDKRASKIHTVFEPVKAGNGFTLVRVKLITGKTHQIRAQASHNGYPIIGERKYKDDITSVDFYKKYRLKYHLLHCESLSFHDIQGPLDYLNNKKFVCDRPKLFNEIEKDIFG